jgi:hypothetical protein
MVVVMVVVVVVVTVSGSSLVGDAHWLGLDLDNGCYVKSIVSGCRSKMKMKMER